jgi:hypothetical protein
MENKDPFINELPQSGEVTLLAVVLEKDLRPKRNGGFFLAFRRSQRRTRREGLGEPGNRVAIVRARRCRECAGRSKSITTSHSLS